MNTKVLGNAGEKMAVEYLTQKGYRVLETNLQSKLGEIDIIAAKGSLVAFVEVKTRRSYRYGRPSEAVGYQKQRHIIKTAQWYAQKNRLLDRPMRFDVLEIISQGDQYSINYIENAFELQ